MIKLRYKYAGCVLAAALAVFSTFGNIFTVSASTMLTLPDDGTAIQESESIELSLNYSEREIVYGSCTYLSDIELFNASGVTIDPDKAEWSSTDESVATVKYGMIFINGIGSTTISAEYEGHTASFNLHVIKPKVSINKEELKDRLVGDRCTDWYTATESSKVTVKSGNKKVVKVNEDGSLKALALGKSVITVKVEGGNTVKYTMNIKKRHIYINDDETLDLSKYIKNVKNYKSAVWSVSDSSFAQITAEGILTPLKCGKVTLNTKLNGKKYKINLRITNYNYMKDIAMDALNDTLRYPASLSVNSILHTGRRITIDYSSMNKYGGYNRDKFIMTVNMNGEYTYKTVSIYD